MNGNKFLVSNLKCIEYLKEAPDEFLELLYHELKEEVFIADSIICKAGDSIDKILFITEGIAEITVRINNIDISIDSLYQGCSMGEYGILGNYTYMFTAKAKSSFVKVVTISKNIIEDFINKSKYLKMEAERCSEPLKVTSDIFLDFRIIRTETKKAKIKKIIKLSVLRYMKIVKVFGVNFSFKNLHSSKEIKNLKKQTTMTSNIRLFNSLIQKLDQISADNSEIKLTIAQTESKIESIEKMVLKLEGLSK